MAMQLDHTSLAESDFPTKDDYIRFATMTQDFVSRRGKQPGPYSPHQFSRKSEPLIEMIDAQTDRALRGRMVADVIQSDDLHGDQKLALADIYYSTSSPNRDDPTHAIVPSAETYVILLKAKRDTKLSSSDVPYMLRNNSNLNDRLTGDIGYMSLNDQQTIVSLEEKHQAPGVLSSHSAEILRTQLINRFKTADMQTDVAKVAQDIRSLVEMSGQDNAIAFDLKDVIATLPEAFSNDQRQRVNDDKRNAYKDFIKKSLKKHTSTPAGDDIQSQQESLSKQVSDTNSLIGNHIDLFKDHPETIAQPFMRLADYQERLHQKPVKSYEMTALFTKLKNSVEQSVINRKQDPSVALSMIMDARTAYPVDDYDHSISNTIDTILKNTKSNSVGAVYATYQDKSPELIKAVPTDAVAWMMRQDAINRLQGEKDLAAEVKVGLMNAVIHFDGSEQKDSRSHMRHDVISTFKAINSDDRQNFLGLMLGQNYPSSSDSELAYFVAEAANTGDPVVRRGAVVVSAKAIVNDLATPATSRRHENASQTMTRIYSDLTSTGDRQAMRKILREQGAEMGMTPQQTNDVLQAMRQSYKDKHNLVRRGLKSVQSFLSSGVDVTALETKVTTVSQAQKLTA